MTYPKLVASMSKKREIVDCQMKLKPTENSRAYTVRILYKGYGSPKVWLIDPVLEHYEGEMPHHLYGKDKKGHPELCVFEPGKDEWNSQKSLACVFVPWVITWLYTYELWLITGLWLYPEASTAQDVDKDKKRIE